MPCTFLIRIEDTMLSFVKHSATFNISYFVANARHQSRFYMHLNLLNRGLMDKKNGRGGGKIDVNENYGNGQVNFFMLRLTSLAKEMVYLP